MCWVCRPPCPLQTAEHHCPWNYPEAPGLAENRSRTPPGQCSWFCFVLTCVTFQSRARQVASVGGCLSRYPQGNRTLGTDLRPQLQQFCLCSVSAFRCPAFPSGREEWFRSWSVSPRVPHCPGKQGLLDNREAGRFGDFRPLVLLFSPVWG